MRSRFIAVPVTGAALLTIGCRSGDTLPAPAFSVTDSAGIDIVESAAPA